MKDLSEIENVKLDRAETDTSNGGSEDERYLLEKWHDGSSCELGDELELY